MTPAKPTADPNADRQQLRRELLKLIVKNESAPPRGAQGIAKVKPPLVIALAGWRSARWRRGRPCPMAAGRRRRREWLRSKRRRRWPPGRR